MAYELREDGTVWVDGTRVFVAFDRGNLWAMIRCTDKATFDGAALDVGLRYINDEGQVVTPRGTTITEMGPYVLTPAVLDADGNEVTPPVVDSRYHVNFWLPPSTVAVGAWEAWAVQWTTLGADAPSNNQEVAKAFGGVELIDPTTINQVANRLL